MNFVSQCVGICKIDARLKLLVEQVQQKQQAVSPENTLEPRGPGTHLLQSRRACFHNIISPVPAIVWVKNGIKRVSTEQDNSEISSGTLVLLPEHQSITVENIPQGHWPYEAQVLTLDRGTFEAAYDRLQIPDRARDKLFQAQLVNSQIEVAFLGAQMALAQRHKLPSSIVQNRCEELILWLAETGVYLTPPRRDTCATRVRNLIAADPGHKWTSAEAGRALSLSEASLRRRLRAENTSFKVLVLDIRMLIALSLLQTTNQKVASIADQVGYRSQSRFSTRFKQRFGLNPGNLRQPSLTAMVHSATSNKDPNL